MDNLNENVPTIRASAQARLLLYRLISSHLENSIEKFIVVPTSFWERILSELEQNIIKSFENQTDRPTLTNAFLMMEKNTKRDLERQLIKLTGEKLWLGVFPQDLLDNFINEHVQLIKNVRTEHLNKISLALKRGIREGLLTKDIAKEIKAQTDIYKKRARLIARNAPLQYSGALTKHNQTSAGIKSYIWQSSRDERVRDSHRKYDGEIFNWDNKGPHPRTEVNCRCDAVPLINRK